ncbi:MAG: hypothetical protein AAFP88_01385, partial [Bacteroidota bacterium]
RIFILKDLGGLKGFILDNTSDLSHEKIKERVVGYLNKKLNENRNTSLRKYRLEVLEQWEHDQTKYVCQIGSNSLRNIFSDVLTRGKLKEATFESIYRLGRILGATPESYQALLNYIIEAITTRYCIEQFITLYQGNEEALQQAVDRELKRLVSVKEWKKDEHKYYGIITKTGDQEASNAFYEIILISNHLVTTSTRSISTCLTVALEIMQEQMQKFQNPSLDQRVLSMVRIYKPQEYGGA